MGCVGDLRCPSCFNASLIPQILNPLTNVVPKLPPKVYFSNNRRVLVDALRLVIRERGRWDNEEAESRYLRWRVHCSEGQRNVDCRDRSWGKVTEPRHHVDVGKLGLLRRVLSERGSVLDV